MLRNQSTGPYSVHDVGDVEPRQALSDELGEHEVDVGVRVRQQGAHFQEVVFYLSLGVLVPLVGS